MSDTTNNDAIPVESTTISGGSGKVKRKWDSKGKKNLLIVVGILLVGFVIGMLMLMSKKPEVRKPSSIPTVNTASLTGDPLVSSEDKEAMAAIEQIRLAKAGAEGKSAFERPIDPNSLTESGRFDEKKLQELTPQMGAGTLPNPNINAPAAAPAPATPAAPALDDAKIKAMEKQIASQLTSWGMDPGQNRGSTSYIRDFKKSSDAGAAGASGSGTAQVSAASAAARRGRVVAPALEATYTARSVNTHNSDLPGEVRTQMLTGPLAGAVLLGQGQMAGEGTRIKFTEASLNGVKFKISAMSVDEITSSDIVDGEYDGRYGQRYALPVLLEGLKAFTTARAQTGTSVALIQSAPSDGSLNGQQGGTFGAQQTPPPTVEQARNAMIAASTGQAAKIVGEGPKTGLALLPRNQTYGVVFLEPVFEGDILGLTASSGSSAPSTGSAPAPAPVPMPMPMPYPTPVSLQAVPENK